MIICDRCGERIINVNSIVNKDLFIYEAAAAGILHNVDLCRNCFVELEKYKKRMESYFMINKNNPRDIFDNVEYWKNND